MRIREILNIENFNPLDVDTTELNKITALIPQEGYIDPSMAEHLATACLRASDICSDLLAQATLYLGYCDSKKRSARSTAITTKITNKVPSTLAKEVYSDDEAFITASNDYNLALAWQTWLENKRDTLIKTHHLCKDLSKNEPRTSWTPPDVISPSPRVVFVQDSDEDAPVGPKKLTRNIGKTNW